MRCRLLLTAAVGWLSPRAGSSDDLGGESAAVMTADETDPALVVMEVPTDLIEREGFITRKPDPGTLRTASGRSSGWGV